MRGAALIVAPREEISREIKRAHTLPNTIKQRVRLFEVSRVEPFRKPLKDRLEG